MNKKIRDDAERPLPELRLTVNNPNNNLTAADQATFSPGLKPEGNEAWVELKIRDKFIEKRSYQAACIYDSKLFVYGGSDLNEGIYHDFNYVDIGSDFVLSYWKQVQCKSNLSPGIFFFMSREKLGPLCRASANLVGDKWIIFGGLRNSTENSNQIWRFDFLKLKWEEVKPKTKQLPPCLDSHSGCIYTDEKGNKSIIVFGGFLGGSVGEYWNNVIEFNLQNEEWIFHNTSNNVSKLAPAKRAGHSAAIIKNDMYVFGGTDGENKFNDLWRYDLRTRAWTQIRVEGGPMPRNGHSVVNYKDGFIIFGGIQDITHEKDDVLYFDASRQKWFILEQDTSLTKSMSPIRRRPSLADDTPGSASIRKKTKKATRSPFARGREHTFTQTPANKDDNSPSRKNSPSNSINGSFWNSKDQEKISPTRNALAESNKEKKKKAFLQKKALLLKEFEISDPTKKLELSKKSPTTEAMKNSIIAITYTRNGKSNDLDSAKRKANRGMTTFFGEISRFQVPVDGKLVGHKPCARDGHSAFIFKDKMLIFGGDRHKMAFNDVYILSVDALISNARQKANYICQF